MSAYGSDLVLAASSGSSCTGECLKSGPWGLAIVLILCVACYFLFKSMSKHLKHVREDFPKDPPQSPPNAVAKADVQSVDETDAPSATD